MRFLYDYAEMMSLNMPLKDVKYLQNEIDNLIIAEEELKENYDEEAVQYDIE
jgi:hypothetical protein